MLSDQSVEISDVERNTFCSTNELFPRRYEANLRLLQQLGDPERIHIVVLERFVRGVLENRADVRAHYIVMPCTNTFF